MGRCTWAVDSLGRGNVILECVMLAFQDSEVTRMLVIEVHKGLIRLHCHWELETTSKNRMRNIQKLHISLRYDEFMTGS